MAEADQEAESPKSASLPSNVRLLGWASLLNDTATEMIFPLLPSFLLQVLGGNNVNGIYALVPTTHPQTAKHFPDMAGLVTMEQFAMLNRTTLSVPKAPTAMARPPPPSSVSLRC